jgi:hypothetical protein
MEERETFNGPTSGTFRRVTFYKRPQFPGGGRPAFTPRKMADVPAEERGVPYKQWVDTPERDGTTPREKGQFGKALNPA